MRLQKRTKESRNRIEAAEERRWYDDACGTAFAMELVGERWSLLIVRELMFGPRRFSELKISLGGISANVLTQRLEGLERAAILHRRKLPPPANVQVYELTPWGYEAETPIQELGRWAVRSPVHDTSLPLSAASIMMSFRTMIDRSRSGERPLALGLRFGLEAFVARVDGAGIAVTRGEPDGADAVATTDPPSLAAIVYGGQDIAAMEAAGAVAITGDRNAFAHFVTLFPLPPKIG
jgi:DNA-binding HxlR family transcriptional regulator